MLLAAASGMSRLAVEDVRAWQLAHAFRLEVCRLLKSSAVASADMRFSVGLFRTARSVEASVGDGYRRGADAVSAGCLEDAGHSLAAALVAIEDGIDRGYFSRRLSGPALEAGHQAAKTIRSLHLYLERCAQTKKGRA
jgi:hypothetical protein